MPTQDEFNTIEKLFRKKYLGNVQQMEKEYGQTMDRVKGRIEHIVLNYSKADGTFDKRYQDRIDQEINALTYWYEQELENWLSEGIEESARTAIKAEDFAARRHIQEMVRDAEGTKRELLTRALGDPEAPFLLIPKYGEGLPRAVRQTVWNERWFDGHTLSDRIWTQERILRQNLHGMIEQSINEGRSAVEFARGVEDYLEKPGSAWTTGIRPSITGRGSVKYNALRLARTETNRAYWKGEQLGHKESIIVKGTKRNLSLSHPTDWPSSAAFMGYDEECQYYAEDDHHGLGPGVFPAGEAVEDHPNGLCYLTSVLLDDKELIEELEDQYDAEQIKGGIPEEETPVEEEFVPAKSIEEAEKWASDNYNMTVNYQNTSLEMANANNEAIAQMYREFPKLNAIDMNVRTMNAKSYYGKAVVGWKEGKLQRADLRLSKVYFKDADAFWRQAQADIDANFHFSGYNLKSTMVHELTHMLEYEIILDKYDVVDQQSISRNIASKIFRDYKAGSVAKEIKKEALSSMGLPEYGRETAATLRELGAYSRTSHSEFLAEAIADALTSEKPLDISKETLKVLKERVGE